MKKVLFMIGSLRKGSFNRMLAQLAEKQLTGKADVVYVNLNDIPLFNQDIEFPAPEMIQTLRKTVSEGDGIWIFTPEYNNAIPGGLKNLLDWLSRPVEYMNYEKGSCVKNKKAMISGVGGKGKTSGARSNLAKLLQTMRLQLIDGEGCGFALPAESFSTGSWAPSLEVEEAIAKQAQSLIENL